VKGNKNLLADTLNRIKIGLIDDNPGAPSDRLVALANQQPARFKLLNNRVYLVENQLKRLCLDSSDEQEAVLKEIHDEAGHMGRYKCQEAIRQRFYWPHWRRDLKDHLRCTNCAMAKNGLIERVIQTLEAMLRTSLRDQNEWSSLVPRCVRAYNAFKHHTTGVSPHSLMYGREARLHLDRLFQLDSIEVDLVQNVLLAVNS